MNKEITGKTVDSVIIDEVSNAKDTPLVKPKKTVAQRFAEMQYAKQSMASFVRWKMSKKGR